VENNTDNYIGYEYINVKVLNKMESLYRDNYPCFGWIFEKVSAPLQGVPIVEIRYKRNRKIRSRMELTRLQHQFDFYVKEILRLEKSKTSLATSISLTMGITGTALINLSWLAYFNNMIWQCIVLAVPGFAGIVMAYYCFKKIRAGKTEAVNILIEKKYDDIYKICEKAHALL